MAYPQSFLDALLSSDLPIIEFGRDVCASEYALKKEWLITNGLGGYASATISGALVRRYHGLLISALEPPLKRTLLLAKLDETLQIENNVIPIHTNIWHEGKISPSGHNYLESFRIIGTTPVWSFRYQDLELVKIVMMAPGENTLLTCYEYRNGPNSMTLQIHVLINNRGHHIVKQRPALRFPSTYVENNLCIDNQDGPQFRLLIDNFRVQSIDRWQQDFFYPIESFRGLEALDDHYHVANFECTLHPGNLKSIIATTELPGEYKPEEILQARIDHERMVIKLGRKEFPSAGIPGQNTIHEPYHHLLLAADQFIVQRWSPDGEEGMTVLAGYPWFSDWGRDTMISLPGLAIVTGRHNVAYEILRTFAKFIDNGMLPNRFPAVGALPEYNTADATLWFFQAINEFYYSTHDNDIIREFFTILEQIIQWHIQGTRYHIKMDPQDGLLYAGEPGVQLTWMDAKVDNWVVTPRIGKPVEINALWYNALSIMSEFAKKLGIHEPIYDIYAKKTRDSYEKFWDPELEYLYDVIDGPDGTDRSLRPNQIFAVSLPFSPISLDRQRKIVATVERHLLTSCGVRSLSPEDANYIGVYGGNQRQRDAAYHQGTVWGWLLGPFVIAWLKVHRNPVRALEFLTPIIRHLAEHAVGTISEIFEGNPPHHPRGCIAQAWSVAEVIRAWNLTGQYFPSASSHIVNPTDYPVATVD
jgi:predicted glycogen debranching enzyme